MGDAPNWATYLIPPDFHRLNWACVPIAAAFGTPVYLVGSVLARADYRDIDLRLILPDKTFKRLGGADVRRLLNVAVSDLIATTAGAPRPIDFQVQSRTEADAEPGGRNALGLHRIPRDSVGG